MQKSVKLFHTALCDGLDWISGYGLYVDPNIQEYKSARDKLINPCKEDVYIQILIDGNVLPFIDDEGDYNVDVTLEMVLQRVPKTPKDSLRALINEEGDAEDADILLQTVLYNEIIFG